MININKIAGLGAIILFGGLGSIFYDTSSKCETRVEGSNIIITPKENYVDDNRYLDLGICATLLGVGLIGFSIYDNKD